MHADKDQLSVVRNKWIESASRRPDDHRIVEAACRLAYRLAHLPEPRHYLWVKSPMAGYVASLLLSQVNGTVSTVVRERVDQALGDGFWPQVVTAVNDHVDRMKDFPPYTSSGPKRREQVWLNIRRRMAARIERQAGAELTTAVREAVAKPVWNALQGLTAAQVATEIGDPIAIQLEYDNDPHALKWSNGIYEPGWAAFFDTFGRLGLDVAPTRGLVELARSSTWYWPFEHCVVLVDPPIQRCLDDRGNLHRDDGIALAYADGWGVWCWHGTRVPKSVIMRAHEISPEAVFSEWNVEVRRVMIERMGLDRLFASRKAECIDRNLSEHRALYRLNLRRGEPVVAVRVECPSTGRMYFLRVPPTIRSCAQAVAWGFGFTRADEYKPLVET